MKSLYAMIIAAVMALPMSIAHAATKDIVDTAAGAGKFETLIAAAKAAGLVETLKGPGPYTVFAPTDEAFAKLLEEIGLVKLQRREKGMPKDLRTFLRDYGKDHPEDMISIEEELSSASITRDLRGRCRLHAISGPGKYTAAVSMGVSWSM